MCVPHDYDNTYHPAMPAVEFAIGPALGELSLDLVGLVDSGADATIIPINYLQAIKARRTRKAWMRGTTGDRTLVDLYVIAVGVGDLKQGYHEVIGSALDDEILIGRDILNHLLVVLNGPAQSVQIGSVT